MFQPLLGYSIQIIIPVIIVLCGGVPHPRSVVGQITPRKDLPSQDRQEIFKDDLTFRFRERKNNVEK